MKPPHVLWYPMACLWFGVPVLIFQHAVPQIEGIRGETACFPRFHLSIGIPVCAIRRGKSKLFCSAVLARKRATSHWGVANHSYIPAGRPTSAWTRPCFVQGLWNAIRNPLRADRASDWMRPPRDPGWLRTLKSCAISPREPIPDSSARHGSKRTLRYKTWG